MTTWEDSMHTRAPVPQLDVDRYVRYGRFFIKLMLALLVLGMIGRVTYRHFLPDGITISRLWNNETKLGVFDSKIIGIGEEFLRRSPALTRLLDEYKACTPNCSPQYYARQQTIVRQEWPRILHRLAIADDWAPWTAELVERRLIRETIARHGMDGAAYRCEPTLTFVTGSKTKLRARFTGLNCKAPGKSGG